MATPIAIPTQKPDLSNTDKITLFDNSRLSDFRKCPRYYLLRHVFDLSPEMKATALTFGSCWHEAMDVIWKHNKRLYESTTIRDVCIDEAYAAFIKKWLEDGMTHPDELTMDEIDELLPRTPMVAMDMLYEYVAAREHIFTDPSFKLIAIERPFAVPLDPNNPYLWYVGRLDKIFMFRNQLVIGEHKTTTSYKKDGPFRSDFIDSFSPNTQVDGYLYAGDLMTKTPSSDLYRMTLSGVWIDAALVHKTVHDGFKFIPQERDAAMLDAWLYETHYWIDQVMGNRNVLNERMALGTPYLAAFPKNTQSCTQYGACSGLDICRTISNPSELADRENTPLGYKREHWSPFLEVKLEQLGFTIEKTTERPPELDYASNP